MGVEEVGQLDSLLRFKPSPGRASNGVALRGHLIKFSLVLTDQHWEVSRDDGILKEVKGAPEWRIAHSPPDLYITVDTAIHYVTDTRAQANDSDIKRNADKTLEALKPYR